MAGMLNNLLQLKGIKKKYGGLHILLIFAFADSLPLPIPIGQTRTYRQHECYPFHFIRRLL